MPVQTAKSSLLAKYGQRIDKAAKEHARDETRYGFQRLPGNISGGVARLVECGFFVSDSDRYKGEIYFRAAGVALTPKSVIYNGNECPVEGLQTSLVEMVCDTVDSNGKKTTLEEHVARIQNTLRTLGADPEALAEGMSALEPIAAQIKEAAPYFKFSTTVGRATIDPKTKKPREPMVFENWHGTKGLEDYVPESHNGVDDTTGHSQMNHPPEGDEQTTGDEGGDAQFDEFGDINSLLEDAKGKNTNDSQSKLEQMALKAGKTQEEVNDAKDWDEVVGWIREGSGDDSGAAPDDQPYEPSKGDPVKIEVLKDPKNPKKGSKNIEVEILTVDKKKKTVTVKSLETGKPITDSTGKKAKEIEWDSLIMG